MSLATRLPCDEAAIQSGVHDAALSPCGPWVLAAAILGSSLAFIDGTVVSVALPAMARELHASLVDMQWVVEAYTLFLSALLLVGGSLGDRAGRKRVFAIGVAIFASASLACALAPSLSLLLAARAAQGVGGALLVPGSLALISASFDREHRGQAIGTWSGFSGITTALGPLLGGWLVSHSWRWAFFLNLPLAAVVLLLLIKVPESRNPHARSLDLPGAALATVGLGGCVLGLVESSRRGWDHPLVLGGLAIGAASLAAFLLIESRSAAPMLPLALFRSRAFAGANLVTLFLYGALATVFFFLPLDLIEVQGYTPLGAGAAILPLIVIMFALSRWAGGLVARHGARLPLLVGPTLAGAGFFALSLPTVGGAYAVTFLPGMIILGLGMSLSVAPLTTTVMNAVPEDNAGVASGVNNAVSRAAGLISIALLGILMAAEGRRALAHSHVAGIAFAAGFRAVARASAALAVLGALCAWIWIPVARPRPDGDAGRVLRASSRQRGIS